MLVKERSSSDKNNMMNGLKKASRTFKNRMSFYVDTSGQISKRNKVINSKQKVISPRESGIVWYSLSCKHEIQGVEFHLELVMNHFSPFMRREKLD